MRVNDPGLGCGEESGGAIDRDLGLCVGVIDTRGTSLGGVPREQKMLKGHLPRVIYHQVYWYRKINSSWRKIRTRNRSSSQNAQAFNRVII